MKLRDLWFAVLIVAVFGGEKLFAQPAQPPAAVLGLPTVSGPDALPALAPSALAVPGAGSVSTAPAITPPEDRVPALMGSWTNGLRFRSGDGAFNIHVGGNAQIDSTWLIGPNSAFSLPNNGGLSGIGGAAASFLRRARLRVEGDIYDQFDFIVEYDFANAANDNSGQQPPSFGNLAGEPAPTNIWMQVRDVPYIGSVRIGNLVKPIGMTNNTSQAFLPFMERADNNDAFYGPFDSGFALGVAARNHTEDERATWQVGIYRPSTNVFGVALKKLEWGARVTALPVYQDDGRVLVHVGFGTLNGELVQNQFRLRARPELRNGPGFANPVLVDTGNVNGSRQYTLAPEFAAVLGSWTVQAEWAGQFFTQATAAGKPDQGTVLFHGGYAEVLYFLTGEHQEYKKADGAFGRVVPNRNLRMKRGEGCSGWGAWQVGARFSYLDLNDKAIRGGVVYDWTAGVNWYWNPNMKVQLNYILEHRDQPGVNPTWINGVGVRGAYDF